MLHAGREAEEKKAELKLPSAAQLALSKLQNHLSRMPTGICVLTGSAGVAGTVTFTTVGAETHVTGEITGLAPGEHGFHVHQVRAL